MCLICNHNVHILQFGGYGRCVYCKSLIAKVLPDNRGIQKVLEDHARSYILDSQKSTDFLTQTTRYTLLKSYSKSARTILDFGCGNGSFVKLLQTKGYNVFGYDKSESIKKYLFEQNIPFYKSIGEMPDSYFDVVTCFDVIEHTTKPWLIIQALRKKLKRGGILIITTPNSQSISAIILGESWWVFGPTAHFILFSTYSLKLLLTKMGFKVLDMSTDIFTPWFTPSEKFLSKILNKLQYLTLFPFKRFLFNNYLGDNIQVIARLSD